MRWSGLVPPEFEGRDVVTLNGTSEIVEFASDGIRSDTNTTLEFVSLRGAMVVVVVLVVLDVVVVLRVVVVVFRVVVVVL